MRLPYAHIWNEFWQWQSKSNFRIWCFFQTKITYTIILLRNLILASHLSFPLSQFTRIVSKFLNCNEFCTNEGRGNTQKELSLASKTSLEVEKLNNSEILKPTRLCQWGLLFRFSVSDEIYCGFAVFGDFLRGFAVSNRPLRPPQLGNGTIILRKAIEEKTLQKWLKFSDCRKTIPKQIQPSCIKIFRPHFVFVWFRESNEI